MATELLTVRRALRRRRRWLRMRVLRLGSLLGWPPAEIIAFAEALAGASWRRLGCAELQAVLDEELAIAQAVLARAARRAAARQGDGDGLAL